VKWEGRIWPLKENGKDPRKGNRDGVVFFLFLFLAFVFWYLNSLSEITATDIKYPVRYVNLPKDRSLIMDLPPRLDLFLKGPGYSILKLKVAGGRRPVVIDISSVNYMRVPGSRNLSYYVVTSGLIPKLAGQLKAECEITAIKPDTLFFALDRIISRRIRIKPDLELVTDRQYFIKGDIVCNPDSVTVAGPAQIVDTMRFVTTRYKKFTGLSEPVKKSIPLLQSDNYTLSERRVSVTLPVEQYTEAEVAVPVTLLNIPDSIDIKIFPDEVKIRCFVAVNDYKILGDYPFNAVIDLKKTDLMTSEKLPVEVLNTPGFVTSLSFSPSSVDFLIEKKPR